MSKTIVRVFSHNFAVADIQPALRAVVRKFSNWFDDYEWQEVGGQWEEQWSNTYALPTHDPEKLGDTDWHSPDLEYRFHINSLPHFKALLEKEGVRADDIHYFIEPDYEPTHVDFTLREGWAPFDDQVEMLDQLILPEPAAKLLGLQTGGGKSALSMFAAKHWGYLTCALMKPGYIDKWVNDVRKQMDIDLKDIVTVAGMASLAELIRNLDNGSITPKVVLISNATFRNWITEQEKLPPGQLVQGFPCEPWEFMQHCGFGFRIIDEVHEDFHFNFLLDLNTHIAQALSLSATLVNRRDYLAKMYKMAYPESVRVAVPEYVKYVRSVAYLYDIADHINLKTSARGRTSYSHVEFEKSIMQSVKLKKQYLLMVYETMRKTYLVDRKPGERCLVFFSTKKMCEEATFYFRQLMPHLKIMKYNMGDPLTNATESDICFATLKKAGTAIDIAMLTTVILTVAIDSIQANLQSLGRLRNLKKLYGSDRVPTYVYFGCTTVRKHMSYHRSKQEMLKQKAAIMTQMHHNVTLGMN